MTVTYTLCVMWVLGLLCGAIYLVYALCEGFAERVIGTLIAIPGWVIVSAAPVVAVMHADSPEFGPFLKSEWRCTESHEVRTYWL